MVISKVINDLKIFFYLVEKKPAQQRSGGGDRNVKFSGESREDHNNRRNREDGDRPPRNQGEYRRGPPG